MEQLYVLGTGNAQAVRCYNTCFAIRDDEEYFLVDAGGGNGILRILEDMDVPLEHIHHIFVTHEHNDHILGMVWMIRMIATAIRKGSYSGNLTVYCHDGLVDTIRLLCTLTIQKKFCALFDDRILFVPLKDGDTKKILDYDVTFFDILSTKARQFGFTTVLKNGRRLTCAGDEPCSPGCRNYVAGSDWLLHEAFCLYRDRERFRPYYTYKKYYSYVFTLGRISSEFTEEYLDRMSREFKRAFDLGEVDLSVFTPYTQKAIELLVKDPQGYYQRYILKKGSGPVNILRRLRRFLGKVKRGIGRRIKKR